MLNFSSIQEAATLSLDNFYLEQDLCNIEKSRFSPIPIVDISEYSRLKNAIFWNVSPWFENCFGKTVTIPDGVCIPTLLGDIKTALQYAEHEEAKIIINWYGNNHFFNGSSKNNKANLLVKLDELSYIKKIDGGTHKYLLGPSVTATQMDLFFAQHQISIENKIDFQGAKNIYDYFLHYLNTPSNETCLTQKFFLYIRLETTEGKFIIEAFNLSDEIQRNRIKDLMTSHGSSIGIISGIGVDFGSFFKYSEFENQNVVPHLSRSEPDSGIVSSTHRNSNLSLNMDVTRNLIRKEFNLTERESYICCLLLEGHGDKALAQKLNLSYWTVRTHVNKVLEKLEISSRLEIARKVLELHKIR